MGENVFERAVQTTIQKLVDKGLFDKYRYGNADQVLKDYFLIEVNEMCRPDLEEVNNVIHSFCS